MSETKDLKQPRCRLEWYQPLFDDARKTLGGVTMAMETSYLGDWGPWYKDLSQPRGKPEWTWMFTFHSFSDMDNFRNRIIEKTDDFDIITVEELMGMLDELEHGYDIFYSTRVMLKDLSGHESEYGWNADTLKVDIVHEIVNGEIEESTLQISQPKKL